MNTRNAQYWDATADLYQERTRISTRDFHYGPLLPGDRELGLLPERVEGQRCLELGCGAGQTSICLSRAGARCTAIDISKAQLGHGRRLAAGEGVRVEFVQGDLDHLPVRDLGRFDLVHSTYALPFAANPAAVLHDAAALLEPGGVLLLTTAHPVYAGEWVEAPDGDEGMLVYNYFHPPDDLREPGPGHDGARARAAPLGEVAEWIRAAGLSIDRLLEPAAKPIPLMTEDEIRDQVPYESDDWRAMYEILSAVPIVAVFRCVRERQTA